MNLLDKLIIEVDYCLFINFSMAFGATNPGKTCMAKVNNRNTRKICEICLKLTINTS